MSDSWVDDGLCKEMRNRVGGVRQALAVFYPDPGRPATRFELLCNRCPVQCECLLWGVLAEDYGGWGGTSEQERKELRADIAEGFTTLADMLRSRGCDAVADRVANEDASAIAEAAQRVARPV